jgi:hypothetical protein
MHAQERRSMKEAVAAAIQEVMPAPDRAPLVSPWQTWGKIAASLGVPTPVLAFVYLVGQSKGWW